MSRLILYFAGLRFNFSLDWMWLSDPADLQDRLLQTIYYFHAFPPGMDLLSGILLKLGGAHAATLAQLTFWVCGLVLVSSLYYLARAAGLSAPVSFVVVVRVLVAPADALLRASLPLRGAGRSASLSVGCSFPRRPSSSIVATVACVLQRLRHYRRDPQHVSPHVVRRDDRRSTVVHPGALITWGPHAPQAHQRPCCWRST